MEKVYRQTAARLAEIFFPCRFYSISFPRLVGMKMKKEKKKKKKYKKKKEKKKKNHIPNWKEQPRMIKRYFL